MRNEKTVVIEKVNGKYVIGALRCLDGQYRKYSTENKLEAYRIAKGLKNTLTIYLKKQVIVQKKQF